MASDNVVVTFFCVTAIFLLSDERTYRGGKREGAGDDDAVAVVARNP